MGVRIAAVQMSSSPQAERPAPAGERFDVVVIGGGVNGVAIAGECARGGKRTLLLEQHDFASGTTSRSTRIIHGGLRYLEHGELGLVRESLRERESLLRERPHLVRRMPFLLALPPGGRHSALAIRAGLWLYDRYARSRPTASTGQAEQLERLLDAGQSLAIFRYDDAQCEFPERLVAERLTEGIADGLVARNHSAVLGVECSDGKVRCVVVRDQLTAGEYRVEAAHIVNASGPWVDRVCSGLRRSAPLLGGVRGSHIVAPRFTGAPEAAIYTEAVDRRPIFLVPWNGQLLVGTTEVRDEGDPGRTQPSADEVDYLIRSVQRLFPGAGMTRSQVIYAFAGVRPLRNAPGERESAITRRSYVVDHADDGAEGLLSIVGGKLTTAGSLAREVARQLGVAVSEPAGLDLPYPHADGIGPVLEHWSKQVASMSKLTESSARAIAEWHGRRALAIARLAAADETLRAPLCPHSEHIVAEAVEAVNYECAVTLGDILLRRVPVALSGCWTEECGRAAAQRIGAAVGWDERRVAIELAQFVEERARFLVKVPTAAESAV